MSKFVKNETLLSTHTQRRTTLTRALRGPGSLSVPSDARRLGFYAQAKFPEYGVTVEQKLLVGGPALALKERAALTPTIATEVFAVELAFMVAEHLLFVFFVSGVTSALPKRKLR